MSHDGFQWKAILETATDEEPKFHADFSENLALTPKSECQDAHFNKRQSSLHCAVAHVGDGNHQFHYHLSDNTNHDVTYVRQVVDDLISKYPDAAVYRFKSDNCSAQYKCRWVFGMWQNIALELGKTVITYHGVPGHG